jgi:hypothetical protein
LESGKSFLKVWDCESLLAKSSQDKRGEKTKREECYILTWGRTEDSEFPPSRPFMRVLIPGPMS